MKEIPIHFWPLLTVAVIRFITGALWFSPALFGKSWAEMVGCTECIDGTKKGMGKAMAADFIGNLVMAFVLLHAAVYAGAASVAEGAAVGFFNWLGFIAMPMLAMVFWERRPWKLYFIIAGFNLVSLLAMGGVLAVWH